MATYKFRVDTSRGAFNFNAEVPDSQWVEGSKHTTLRAARRAEARLIADMREAIGPTGWSQNFRIIALRDTSLTWTSKCEYGASSLGYKPAPGCLHEQRVTRPWKTGDEAPRIPAEVWSRSWQCPVCMAADDDAEE